MKKFWTKYRKQKEVKWFWGFGILWVLIILNAMYGDINLYGHIQSATWAMLFLYIFLMIAHFVGSWFSRTFYD